MNQIHAADFIIADNQEYPSQGLNKKKPSTTEGFLVRLIRWSCRRCCWSCAGW